MTFCLNAKIIEPEDKNIKNAVILLHGYGGDGNDIAPVAINWKRFLPNTIFICPDGPETCSINPMGYQWFDLNSEDEEYITKKALEAEDILKEFIVEIKNKFNFLKFLLLIFEKIEKLTVFNKSLIIEHNESNF